MFDHIVLLGDRFVVVGDFNVPGVAAGQVDPHVVDVFSQYCLRQHVTGPTHASGNTLDLILSRRCGQHDLIRCCFSSSMNSMTQEKLTLLNSSSHFYRNNVTQLCHQWWKFALTVFLLLRVSQSRSTFSTRRPSVFGANIYYQHLGFSSDTDETDI